MKILINFSYPTIQWVAYMIHANQAYNFYHLQTRSDVFWLNNILKNDCVNFFHVPILLCQFKLYEYLFVMLNQLSWILLIYFKIFKNQIKLIYNKKI